MKIFQIYKIYIQLPRFPQISASLHARISSYTQTWNLNIKIDINLYPISLQIRSGSYTNIFNLCPLIINNMFSLSNIVNHPVYSFFAHTQNSNSVAKKISLLSNENCSNHVTSNVNILRVLTVFFYPFLYPIDMGLMLNTFSLQLSLTYTG